MQNQKNRDEVTAIELKFAALDSGETPLVFFYVFQIFLQIF